VGKQFGEIVSIMQQRRTQDAVLFQGMIENRDRYNADVVIPLPDVSGIPAANRPGPNFFQEAIDGHARSANGAMPKVSCPVKNPDSQHSIDLADRRQGALYGAWYDCQLDNKLNRSYRHLAAYGTCAFIVIPSDKLGRADIQIRDPLTAYPELRAQDDIRAPSDCGFLFARSPEWIKQNYPGAPDYLTKSSDRGWDTLWDIVEWIDEDEEEQFTSVEGISDAVAAGLAQEIAQGAVTTVEAARVGQLIVNGMSLIDARLQAAGEMAAQGPAPGTPGGAPPMGAPGPGGQPGQPIPPGLAQALAAQGAGPSAAPGEAVPMPQPGLMNLRHVLQGVNEQVSPGAT
jgi:hypothetical protein